jgi:hypothetical protein
LITAAMQGRSVRGSRPSCKAEATHAMPAGPKAAAHFKISQSPVLSEGGGEVGVGTARAAAAKRVTTEAKCILMLGTKR